MGSDMMVSGRQWEKTLELWYLFGAIKALAETDWIQTVDKKRIQQLYERTVSKIDEIDKKYGDEGGCL